MKEEKIKMTLIQGNCLKVLPTIPDESVDLILTDPPYCNIVNVEWDKYDESGFLNFIEKCLIEFKRILKDGGSIYVFGMLPIVKHISLIMDKHFTYQNWITWAKSRGRATVGKFGSNREEILFYSKGNPKTFHRQDTTIPRQYGGADKRDYVLKGKKLRKFVIATDVWTDIMEVGISPKEKPIGHPTQKSIKLINRIILASSNENDVVLDAFLGSGTTMKACLELKRNCIGIEINPEYIDITKKRLNWGSSLSNKIEWEFKNMSELK